MNTDRVRVLVVDDSAFARKVLRESLEASPRVQIVAAARDGLEGLELYAELKPDVVTLDLVMPNLDGLGFLHGLAPADRLRVVVVSTSDADSDLGVQALQAGAFDLVHKPTALATDRLYELSEELVLKVLAAAERRPLRQRGGETFSPEPTGPRPELIVLGTSTGGPQAITRVLGELPAGFPVPIAIALHIPQGYTESLARRLDKGSALSVVEAGESTSLEPGRAVLARGGLHLEVARGPRGLVAHTRAPGGDSGHVPSVDLLFQTAARACGARVLGVVLTGMGNDGTLGAQAIHEVGGAVVAESEESCVVYGMPRCVVEAGLAAEVVALDRVPAMLLRRAR